MSYKLKPSEKRRVQVCFGLIVVALILQKADKEAEAEQDNPAVQQIAILLSELVDERPEEARQAMRDQINRRRGLFSKKVEKYATASALVGALETITTVYKTKPGTRLAFIIDTFKKNLSNIKEALPASELKDDQINAFAKKFRAAILK